MERFLPKVLPAEKWRLVQATAALEKRSLRSREEENKRE